MMLKCWSESAKSRPSFSELCEELDATLSTETAQVIISDGYADTNLYQRTWHVFLFSQHTVSQTTFWSPTNFT